MAHCPVRVICSLQGVVTWYCAPPMQGSALCEDHLLLETQPRLSDPLGGVLAALFLACWTDVPAQLSSVQPSGPGHYDVLVLSAQTCFLGSPNSHVASP